MRTGERIEIIIEGYGDDQIKVRAQNMSNNRLLFDAWITSDQPRAMVDIALSGVTFSAVASTAKDKAGK
jgi:hypothetical protein